MKKKNIVRFDPRRNKIVVGYRRKNDMINYDTAEDLTDEILDAVCDYLFMTQTTYECKKRLGKYSLRLETLDGRDTPLLVK